MKRTRYQFWIVLVLALANGFFAAAQSNPVAGPTDYASFSRFITERNIFDPNRYPRNSREGRTRSTVRTTRTQRAAPAFTLVGTMSYGKGMFAFFDGNNAGLRKVLPASGDIAGYTVTEVTLAGVKLQSADQNESVQMKIGEMMRQEGGHWQPAGMVELGSGSSATGSASSGESGADTGSAAAPAAASSAGEPNDILKKLMQQREQELK
ncbi:MAG TPA: hypothetical protein VNN22_25545 [Verrucomicrobiae bacterium]|nr:hypothetical protein [Verrucomicrobiae bacterium]